MNHTLSKDNACSAYLDTLWIQEDHAEFDRGIGEADFGPGRKLLTELRHRPELSCNAGQLAICQLQAQQPTGQLGGVRCGNTLFT